MHCNCYTLWIHTFEGFQGPWRLGDCQTTPGPSRRHRLQRHGKSTSTRHICTNLSPVAFNQTPSERNASRSAATDTWSARSPPGRRTNPLGCLLQYRNPRHRRGLRHEGWRAANANMLFGSRADRRPAQLQIQTRIRIQMAALIQAHARRSHDQRGSAFSQSGHSSSPTCARPVPDASGTPYGAAVSRLVQL